MNTYNVNYRSIQNTNEETQLDAKNLKELYALLLDMWNELEIEEITSVERAARSLQEVLLDHLDDFVDSLTVAAIEDMIKGHAPDWCCDVVRETGENWKYIYVNGNYDELVSTILRKYCFEKNYSEEGDKTFCIFSLFRFAVDFDDYCESVLPVFTYGQVDEDDWSVFDKAIREAIREYRLSVLNK